MPKLTKHCGLIIALLVAGPPVVARAQDALGADFLTKKERKELEEKRRREAPPVLGVEPKMVSVDILRGERASVKVTVKNEGGRILEWAATAQSAGTRAKPEGGRLGHGESCGLEIEIDSAELPLGPTVRRVSIVAPDTEGSPVEVSVSVRVLEPAKPAEPLPPEEPVEVDVDDGAVEADADREPPLSDRDGRPRRFGVRVGYAGYGTPDEIDVRGSPVFGIMYRNGRRGRRSYELGLDVSQSEAENASFTTTFVATRCDLVLRLGNGEGNTRPYVLSGLCGLIETVNDVNSSAANSAMAVNLGVGACLGGDRLDLRATYSVLLGSDNASGVALVSAGVQF